MGRVLKCRFCGAAMPLIFADLGEHPPSNAYLFGPTAIASETRYPLCAVVCKSCHLVQLNYDVPPAELFSDYAYFSSYSDSWGKHAKDYCNMAIDRFELNSKNLVVELGSNDGYLLKNLVAEDIPVLGIDPSDTVAAAAEKVGVPTLVEFFGKALAEKMAAEGKQADLVIGNNVLAQVPDINDFVGGIKLLLKPEGNVTMEFPHLLALMDMVAFDTIYHEHFFYLSLIAVENIFSRNGLRIYDSLMLPTHGGSLRIFACHEDRGDLVDRSGLLAMREKEKAAGLFDSHIYKQFIEKVRLCGESMKSFLTKAKAEGKVVAAYGAAAKGNTLLNYIKTTVEDVIMVADRNPHKQKKLLPGSHIPVVSPEELKEAAPDYVLILPWNLKDEVMAQLPEVWQWGGRFVTPVPLVKII